MRRHLVEVGLAIVMVSACGIGSGPDPSGTSSISSSPSASASPRDPSPSPSISSSIAPDATPTPTSSPTSDPAHTPDASSSPPVEGALRALGFATAADDLVEQTRLEQLHARYPAIELVVQEDAPGPDLLLTAIYGPDPPDLIRIPRGDLGTYASRGLLEPLDACDPRVVIDPSVFHKSAVMQVTWDGRLYGLPEFLDAHVWLINDQVFQAAGLDPDTFDWGDWEAIAEAQRSIARVGDGRPSGIGIDPGLPDAFPLWVRANGGTILSDDGMESLLGAPAVVEALTFTTALVDETEGDVDALEFLSDPTRYHDLSDPDHPFVRGAIGAALVEMSAVDRLMQSLPDQPIRVAPFVNRDRQPTALADGGVLAIVAGSADLDAACAAIDALTDAETWIAAAEARHAARVAMDQPDLGLYSGNRAADDVIFHELVDFTAWPSIEPIVDAALAMQDAAFALPTSAVSREARGIRAAAIDHVLHGRLAPLDALTEADDRIQQLLDGR